LQKNYDQKNFIRVTVTLAN